MRRFMFRLALACGEPDIRKIESLPFSVIREWQAYWRFEPFGDVQYGQALLRKSILLDGDSDIAAYMPRTWHQMTEEPDEVDAETAAALFGAHLRVIEVDAAG